MAKQYNDPFHHVDYNAITNGTKGNGVQSGFVVTERGAGQNMSVDVASGVIWVNNIKYTESSTTNVTISAAHATLPRRDTIIYDSATSNPVVITGTAATEPIPPDVTSDDILLVVVNIAAGVSVITNSDIEDGRVSVSNHNLIIDHAHEIVPTLTSNVWTTPMSNLSNITDGDMSTTATQSTTNIDGDIEEILIDLGALKNAFTIIYSYILETPSTTNLTGKIYTSPDNSNWTEQVSNTKTDGSQTYSGNCILSEKIRYIKFWFQPSYTGTSHANIKNLICLGLLI